MEMKEENRTLPVAIYGAGLVLMFLGERVFPTINAARMTFSFAGFGLAVTYFVMRLRGAMSDSSERRAIDRLLAVFAFLTVLGLALAFSTTEAGEKIIRIAQASTETKDKFETLATIAWIALITVSAIPIFFAERALFPMRRAESLEGRRVLSAVAAGLTLGLAATYGSLFTYAAGELDIKADYSYFRTARPSESTRNIVKGLEEPVKVSIFFPPVNDVGREVASYLRELTRANPRFTYEVHDRLLEPQLSRDWKVTQDGVLVLARGATDESLIIGVDMEAAKPKLKTLDADFQKALIKVSRDVRIAYFTTGHGEMNEQPDPVEGRSTNGARKLLESQNYNVRDLGLAQGLGNEIPKDATIVLVLGPKHAFLPGEVAALKKYAEGGGHLFLALDPDAKVDLDPLAEVAGLTFEPLALANEKIHLRRRYNDSDNGVLVSNRFSSHASVSTLSRASGRAHVIFAGAGGLEMRQSSPLKADFCIKSMQDTFVDANGDFHQQENERRSAIYNLAAAVSNIKDPHANIGKDVKEMRAFVIGDADAVSDFFFGNEANVVMFLDAIRWLGGEESFAGAIASSEDVKIEHTKQKDLVLFYGTIFLIPALVLGLGLLVSRRPRSRSGSLVPPAAAAAPEGKGA